LKAGCATADIRALLFENLMDQSSAVIVVTTSHWAILKLDFSCSRSPPNALPEAVLAVLTAKYPKNDFNSINTTNSSFNRI
jgi:hypothetical protein